MDERLMESHCNWETIVDCQRVSNRFDGGLALEAGMVDRTAEKHKLSSDTPQEYIDNQQWISVGNANSNTSLGRSTIPASKQNPDLPLRSIQY